LGIGVKPEETEGIATRGQGKVTTGGEEGDTREKKAVTQTWRSSKKGKRPTVRPA